MIDYIEFIAKISSIPFEDILTLIMNLSFTSFFQVNILIFDLATCQALYYCLNHMCQI